MKRTLTFKLSMLSGGIILAASGILVLAPSASAGTPQCLSGIADRQFELAQLHSNSVNGASGGSMASAAYDLANYVAVTQGTCPEEAGDAFWAARHSLEQAGDLHSSWQREAAMVAEDSARYQLIEADDLSRSH
ncbi:hypothetical protein [Embleya sp. NPDC059237]|uniref:hypothetical protein n=1 Tax=Embleya sp. NPDC059237 TaxID=3346784 RepID=UPI0036A9188E